MLPSSFVCLRSDLIDNTNTNDVSSEHYILRSFDRWGFYNRIVRIMHNPSHHKLSLVIGFLFLGELAINPEVLFSLIECSVLSAPLIMLATLVFVESC